jgi:ribosomal protein S18 acetylase RimI-like enzyme
MSPMNPEIAFGVPPNQKVAAAEIFYEAFEDKFSKIFGPKKQAISFFSECLRNDRTVAASCNSILVGVAGLKFGGKESIDAGFWQLIKHVKLGIFRFLVLGWIFFNKVEQNEVLVDMLAVDKNMRSKGIGNALIDFIVDFARSEGYERVRLFVIDTNERAKTFYERMGFSQSGMKMLLFPWNRILGFNGAHEMVYTIT